MTKLTKHALTKALGNDGVIALCIDDAGPTLASLTNELLLGCYGPRFTVSITTQVETARKDLKEGFDRDRVRRRDRRIEERREGERR